MIVGSPRGGIEVRNIESPLFNLTGAQLVQALGIGTDSFTGLTITPEKALTGTVAVYACVNLLAGTAGSLPNFLYQKIDEDRREKVSTVPRPGPTGWPQRLARMLHSTPCPELTAQELWEMVVGHSALWGNAFLNVVRAGDGRPGELWPLRPDKMRVLRDKQTREKFYRYTDPLTGQGLDLTTDEVMHVKWFGTDGLVGLSPIGVARNAVGIEQAAAEFAGRFYANSAVPGGVVTLADTNLEKAKEKAKLIREEWQSRQGGLSNSQRMAVLYGGASWQATGMPLDDAQFLETRRFQIGEIARLFGIPPHMVGDVERSTSWGTGIEQQGIGFLVYTLAPILGRIEAAANRDLGLVPGVRTLADDGFYAEFAVDALLRGDVKSRYEAYAIGRQWGFLATNTIHRLENLPPVDGGDEDYIVPVNYVPLSQLISGQMQQSPAQSLADAVKALAARNGDALVP